METQKPSLRTSYSSTQNYIQCPRRWWLRDLRQLAPDREERTGALPFGSRIHTALDWWETGKMGLRDAWATLCNNEADIEEERGGLGMDAIEKEALLGAAMLEGFETWWEEEGEDQEYEVIAVEQGIKEAIEVVTPAGEAVEVMLYGKPDQVMRHRDNGSILIRDWKTTRLLEEKAKASLEMSPQPRIYSRMLQQAMPGENVAGIRYTFLRKVKRTAAAKPPFWFSYDLMLSQYNIDHHMRRLAAVTGKMVETRQLVEAGVDPEQAAPFNPGQWCSTCPFQSVCFVMQTVGMDAAEEMLEDNFIERDPMERYAEEEGEE